MPTTFEKLLAELIKRAGSPDDPINREFRDGDLAHLQRWLDCGGANKTWGKIFEGSFNSGDAFVFVMAVLEFRRDAEETDTLNKTIAALNRRGKQLATKERQRAIKKLAKSEIAPDQYAAYVAHIDEHDPAKNPIDLDPLLSVRSDEEGTRQRTLFCRKLSDLLLHTTGRPHDAEVAALCQIALDGGDVTIDMVRSGRRESTRKKRPTKR